MKNHFYRSMLLTLVMCAVAISSYGQSNHTVTLTGNASDFNNAEKYTNGVIDYYVTFDQTYLYVGAFKTNGNFDADQQALAVFIDTDPQATPSSGTGTTTGNSYNGVTATLPFNADQSIRVERSYQERRSGAAWTGYTTSFTGIFASPSCREFKLAWSDIGSPVAVYLTMFINYSGGYFAEVPAGGTGGTGSNPTFSNYFGGFGTSAGGCTPKDITNDPITGSATNVAASGAKYGKLTISSNTSASGNSSITSGGSLVFSGGILTLGSNTLTMASGSEITGASGSSYIATDGSGTLTRNGVGAANTLFPIGTSTTYNPATINNAGTADNFSVSVKGSFDTPPNDANVVLTRQWTIAEAIPGGSNATLSFQYNTSDPKGALFTYGGPSKFIGRYTGSQWVATAATLAGSDPYTVTASGFNAFSPFGISEESGALPIQLSSFTGSIVSSRVKLDWATVSEVNNYGFYVQRRTHGVMEWLEIDNSFVAGHGTTNVPQQYTFTENAVAVASTYYRLKQVDLDGTTHFTEPILVDSPTSVPEVAPKQFALLQNYPNPFNPSTEIKFSVEATDHARLAVYNSLGQKVAMLFDGIAEAGQYYKVKFSADHLASGVYFYHLQSGKKNELKKLMLLK